MAEERLTAVVAELEFTSYDENHAVTARRVVKVGAVEANIPQEVLSWLRSQER